MARASPGPCLASSARTHTRASLRSMIPRALPARRFSETVKFQYPASWLHQSFAVMDPTDLGVKIVVAQALCLTIFNLSSTQNTRLFTDDNTLVRLVLWLPGPCVDPGPVWPVCRSWGACESSPPRRQGPRNHGPMEHRNFTLHCLRETPRRQRPHSTVGTHHSMHF